MAVLSSSRGVAAANVDKTKHLFLIFTLLTLLCPASSFIDDEKLKLIRENILKLQQDAVMRKVDNMVDMTFLPDLFEDLLKLMDSLAGTMKNLLPNSEYIPKLMKQAKGFMKETLVYLIKEFEMEEARTQEYEDKAKQLERVIEKLAQSEATM